MEKRRSLESAGPGLLHHQHLGSISSSNAVDCGRCFANLHSLISCINSKNASSVRSAGTYCVTAGRKSRCCSFLLCNNTTYLAVTADYGHATLPHTCHNWACLARLVGTQFWQAERLVNNTIPAQPLASRFEAAEFQKNDLQCFRFSTCGALWTQALQRRIAKNVNHD